MHKKESRRKFLSTSAKVVGACSILPIINKCAKTVTKEGKTLTVEIPEVNTAVVLKEDNLVISRLANHIYALTNVCNHLGCLVSFDKENKQITCPCHGSKFSLDGTYIEGPAKRGLDRYKIILTENGKLTIDMSTYFKDGTDEYYNSYVKYEE